MITGERSVRDAVAWRAARRGAGRAGGMRRRSQHDRDHERRSVPAGLVRTVLWIALAACTPAAAWGDDPPAADAPTQAERMTERGFVRYRGAWRTRQEIELIERAERAEAAQREWAARLEKLRRRVDDPAAGAAAEELRSIRDPVAVSALAAALQTVLVSATAGGAIVAFDTGLGTLTFTAPTGFRVQFPTERELRDQNWRAANWDSVHNAPSYSMTDPKSFNGQLFFPSPSSLQLQTVTGNIDMTPYREVYLASSLTNYRTLQSGTGAKDILARIPIDVDYGQVVSYRHLGPSDALSASDEHFRVLRFRFVDWAGRLVPIDQPVVIELVFLDSDPYAM